jgi:hypothetical protein
MPFVGGSPDVFLPADPAALPGRLRAAGFADPEVEGDAGGDRFRFAATRPGGAHGSASPKIDGEGQTPAPGGAQRSRVRAVLMGAGQAAGCRVTL